MLRLPWTISQVGVEQFVGLLAAGDGKGLTDRATAAFETWTQATGDQLDHLVAAAIRAGNGLPGNLPGNLAEQLFHFFTPEALAPGSAVKKGFDLAQQAVEALEAAAPSRESRMAWRELGNKLQSFGTFRSVDSVLQVDAAAELSLGELVDRAGGLEPYSAVWTTEGLGHYWAERAWERGETPSRLLTGETVDRALIALHAGMGLSMARRSLQALDAGSPTAQIRRQLHHFVALCRDNSMVGYTEVALEALGLIGRTLHPELVPAIDQQLASLYPEILAYFWHGVGRGSYFLPLSLVPRLSSASRAVELLRREAPHELAWTNALSGLAWPLILVNIRHPEIVESCLAQHADLLDTTDAFASGAGSAIATWFDSTGGDPHLVRFCQYRPEPATGPRARLWESQVREPCREALKYYYPALKERGLLGTMFQYYSLDQEEIEGEMNSMQSLQPELGNF
jgi:hypothetical protein